MRTDIMMMLFSDTYKHTHPRMYPKNQNKLVSYLVARKNMSSAFPEMVFYGLQPFIIDYLIIGFEKQFFNLPLSEVEQKYKHYMDIQIGMENTEWHKIEALHNLGYLPLEIRALPEGTIVNSKTYAAVGASEITNQTTSGSIAATAETNAVSWTFADGGSYFAIGMISGGTSGTTKVGTVTIVYEAN